ncbi:glycoside hydrolase family 18 protein [Moniliophthora roreri]|nr:glycoside hydrolase family 18 protein [Moniliophthora roreri]
MVLSVTIPPRIIHTIRVNRGGKVTFLERRYPELLALNDAIGAKGITLPPKHILVTTFVPSAWVDDRLIAERKAGLAKYLSNIIQIPEYEDYPALLEFLKGSRQPH